MISIRDTFRGKHLLVTGTAGFLGKVWLAMLLERVPEVGRITVLIRKKGWTPALKRFEKMLGTSPVFQALHEQYGEDLPRFVAERVEVVEGDVAKPDLGLSAGDAERLRRELDLVVHCAGLVDFNPDLRLALSSNSDSALRAAELAGSCDHARLVHVSTCYVAGRVHGRIREDVTPTRTPSGELLDAAAEVLAAREEIERITREHTTEQAEAALRDEVLALVRDRELDESNPAVIRNMTRSVREKKLEKVMKAAGTARAERLGWTNTYTYTKALGEALLVERAAELGLEHTIIRPSIVESAQRYPFAGWNEGYNTSGPLVYLLGTWFRHFPCKPGNPFDVIPVDMVCNALTIAAAALLRGEHSRVYHVSTGERNPFTIDRACELTALGHRKHLRKHGESTLERLVLSRWDCIPYRPEHALSPASLSRTANRIGSALRKVPGSAPSNLRKRAEKLADATDSAARQLHGVDKMLGAYMPFIHDQHYQFVADALRRHEVREPEFRFEPESIHWRSYWMDVHMPGMRKWCFPLYEGKAVPEYQPKTAFVMPRQAASAAVAEPPEGLRSERPLRRAVGEG